VYTCFQSHKTVSPDDIKLEAESPTGRLIKMNGDGIYHAQFGKDEIGGCAIYSLIVPFNSSDELFKEHLELFRSPIGRRPNRPLR